jgi:hypothetical protein
MIDIVIQAGAAASNATIFDIASYASLPLLFAFQLSNSTNIYIFKL